MFADMGLIWLAPVLLVVIASKLFRHDFRGDDRYAAIVLPSTDNPDTNKEQSSKAA
ncbi:MAG: hypothetical protein ACRED6_11470 [Stellaceae bacterium]